MIESALPDHKDIARKVISAILPHTGESVRLVLPALRVPEKSTFIEALGMMLIQKVGHRSLCLRWIQVAKRSGGSILADKTRMENLSIQEKAFIRPSPSGVTLGGVARKTRETMLICEAAGYDVVLIETVGVGQSENDGGLHGRFFPCVDDRRRGR